MLGKLFNLGAGSGAGSPPTAQAPSHKSVTTLDSVQEDIHTRNLLFPDPQDLFEQRLNHVFPLSSTSSVAPSSSTNAFDYSSDIELDVRDVRVIIMQDTLGPVSASLLYDSQTPPAVPTTSPDRSFATVGPSSLYLAQEARRGPLSPRKASASHAQRPIIIQPGSPKIRQGAFETRTSVHGRNPSHVESESQRTLREYREELATFSSCIFGNSELMAYKGISTKVHVVPSDNRGFDSASVLGDGRGSMGRSSMRASRLSQSFSSESAFAMPPTPGLTNRPHDRKRVLVTRLFPVSLPTEDDTVPSPRGAAFTEEAAGYPFPQGTEDPKPKKKKPQQKRTPMYAVALVINLPPATSAPASTSRTGFRNASSYSEQDSFPSSYSSTRPSGWTVVGPPGHGFDSFETTFGGDTEDQIDAITQHWDIIMRTLNHLQFVVSNTIFTMLKQTDLASPDPLPSLMPSHMARNQSYANRRGEDGPPMKPPKTNAKLITLLPNCLLDHRRIILEADQAKTRIVAGIRAARVTTGQNRWPIWREEARWVAKWAGGREQGFFFHLLTGFLATHTDWLQALSPLAYRRRHFIQQKGKVEEDTSVPARTIIMAPDKSVARRLIFLLAAFLPASQQLPSIRAHRPSTSTSIGTFSQSPPSYIVPILKEESLRRRLNRRAGPMRASHTRNLSLQSQQGRAGAVPPPLAHLSIEGRHERRASDAASIRTTQLPIRGSDLTTRKSSAATTGTITPENSVPHFASVQRPDIFSHGRPGSGNSMAANDLKRLTREDSTGSHGSEPRQSSRWGSVISGLWNPRRRDSSAALSKPRALSIGNNGNSSRRTSVSPSNPHPGTLVESSAEQADKAQTSSSSDSPKAPETPGRGSNDNQSPSDQTNTVTKAQRIPDPSGAFESPVKTSINIDDGVIDVDIAFPDYIAPFETAVSSPSSSGYLSTPGFGTAFEAFEQSSRLSMDGDVPLNVAGWLQNYHPDFVVQALPVQEGLIEQVKASMKAEPPSTLPASSGPPPSPGDRWVDVSTAIVANCSTFTITRIRYRRLLRPKTATDLGSPDATPPLNSSNPPLPTPVMSPYETQIKDEFIEETLVGLDDVLVEAVEKVIAANATETSKGSSSSSSRSTSNRRERSSSAPRKSEDRPRELALPQEVPRSQCKTVLLSALEEIIRDVVEEVEQQDGKGGAALPSRDGSVLREAVRRWIESLEMSD